MSVATSVSDQDGDGSRQPVHVPVLLAETLLVLDLGPGLVVVDGTVGAGGHARAIARALGPTGHVIGLDRDSEILDCARAAFVTTEKDAHEQPRVSLFHLASSQMKDALVDVGCSACDRVLLDLGVSSLQLDKAERGFSFMVDGPLDMRMDATAQPTAAEWLRRVDEIELARVLFTYGDERYSRRIARAIIETRRQSPLQTTRQLAQLIVRALPMSARHGHIHPATRSFQAIRMAVNGEVAELQSALAAALACLKPGGRLAVISFHSGEDRIVKHFLREHCAVLTKKPIEATPLEVDRNPRSRSARLRCGIAREVAA